MYKSLDIRDGSEVVILDPKWLRALKELRILDQQDLLVCQGCIQPVRVRAGKERRPHFAHKHLLNCTFIDESPVLRNARAVLYEWLVSKFKGAVTIEKKIDGDDFFRPIDCWVEQDSKVFAYWIFDTTLKPEKREQISKGFGKLGVNANFIFTLDMLRKDRVYPDCTLLTTTEREFMQKSEYDEVMETGFVTGKSLHYLDADNRKMLTFRGLHLIHQPQVYGGHNFTSNLSEVVVSPQNGEFIHPGEHERLKQYREEQGVLEERRKQLRQYFRKPEFQRSKIGLASSPYLTGQEKSLTDQAISESVMTIDREEIKSSSYSSQQKEGVCVFCGETTTDWWYYDGKTGQCKCKACLRQGKS